jgi:hypothetical protein
MENQDPEMHVEEGGEEEEEERGHKRTRFDYENDEDDVVEGMSTRGYACGSY